MKYQSMCSIRLSSTSIATLLPGLVSELVSLTSSGRNVILEQSRGGGASCEVAVVDDKACMSGILYFRHRDLDT